MQRILILCLCLALLPGLLPTPVQAEGLQDIPWDGVNAPLLTGFEGFTVISWLQIAGTDWGFVSLKKGDQNVLGGYTFANGQWTQAFINEKAFPQGEMRMLLGDASDSQKFSVHGNVGYEPFPQHWGKALFFCWSNGEYYEDLGLFELGDQGVWQLSHYARAGQSGMMDVSADTLYFLEESAANAVIKVRVERDLRSFDLSRLPQTPAQARQPDALPPTIPTGFLSAREMGLDAGSTYPVYSAPDKASLRGAKGKAAVSGKGWVQVFGREGDFLMVQYAVSAGHFRLGYVPLSALSEYRDVPEPLDFTPVPAKALRQVDLTDDPLGQGQALLPLQAGQAVTLLSKMGEFAYLETRQGKKTARGFAPLDAFDAAPQPALGLRLASLQTVEGEEQVLLKRYANAGMGLAFWADSQRLSVYEPGDFIRIDPWRTINEDNKSLTIYPAAIALYAYDWQRRHAAGEDMENPAAGLGLTPGDQPIYPPAPPFMELTAKARDFYTWDGWRIQDMGRELEDRFPQVQNASKAGFYAFKQGQVSQVLCLETENGSIICTIQYPQEAAYTWGTRFLYALDTLELLP